MKNGYYGSLIWTWKTCFKLFINPTLANYLLCTINYMKHIMKKMRVTCFRTQRVNENYLRRKDWVRCGSWCSLLNQLNEFLSTTRGPPTLHWLTQISHSLRKKNCGMYPNHIKCTIFTIQMQFVQPLFFMPEWTQIFPYIPKMKL